MKKTILALVAIIAATMSCYAATACAAPATSDILLASKHSKSSTVYYVIVGSYSTLEAAKKYNYECPDGLEGSIFEATANGKRVYRVAISCHYSKARAQEEARSLNEFYNRDIWVMPSKGQKRILHYATNPAGERVTLRPQ